MFVKTPLPLFKTTAFLLGALFLSCSGDLSAEPPFGGTIFIDPDIITKDDPTTFVKIGYLGQGTRQMFDRRINKYSKVKAHLFRARYSDAADVEVQVNTEFTKAKASSHALKYAKVIGRIPVCLRKDVDTVWIHDGFQPFGGGNRNLLIHVLQGKQYETDGILEETFVHEASHTSLDATHSASKGWLKAQKSDPEFISTYARDNPTREDIAESFLPYLAVRYRADRISPELAAQIKQAIPARIKYFDSQKLKVSPVK